MSALGSQYQQKQETAVKGNNSAYEQQQLQQQQLQQVATQQKVQEMQEAQQQQHEQGTAVASDTSDSSNKIGMQHENEQQGKATADEAAQMWLSRVK